LRVADDRRAAEAEHSKQMAVLEERVKKAIAAKDTQLSATRAELAEARRQLEALERAVAQ
jgi:chromosome segregation ATPase